MSTTYAEFSPTSLDSHITLDNREQWIVAPCSINRDTCDPLELSNWETLQAILDDASAEYEIHRFNHWANGWFELILVAPEFAHIVDEIESRLENYPILDEEHYSNKEHETQCEDWDNYGRSDFVRELTKLADAWDWDNVTEDNQPFYDGQTHCQHSGMPIISPALCPCGDCVTTQEQAQTIVVDWLDNATNDDIDELAEQCHRETFSESSGTVFRHKPTLEMLIDAAGLYLPGKMDRYF